MNEETAFIGGHRVTPTLKGYIRLLMNTHNRPEVVHGVQQEIIKILDERSRIADILQRTEMALDDTHQGIAKDREQAEEPAIIVRARVVFFSLGLVIGFAGWGLIKVLS